MNTTPLSTTGARSRQFSIQLQYLMITIAVLSVSLLCILASNWNTPATELGHLRSSWFCSPTKGQIEPAFLDSADSQSMPGPSHTIHS